jgi:hypothetical protein
MFRKILMLLLILIVGICLFPFLANYTEGMTSEYSQPNPNTPPPNPNTPSTNPNTPSTNPNTPPPNPNTPSTNPNTPSTNPNTPPPNPNTNTTYSNYPYVNYNDSLPKGIPQNQIIPGQEHLYILKSQVVPPVCPACNPVVIYKNKQCEACPACARCPEPSFECKKVPNYNAVNNEFLPKPVLNSFSSFGM